MLRAHAADPGAALFPTLVRRHDDPDLTIVAYGGMLPVVEKVARAVGRRGSDGGDCCAIAALSRCREHTLLDLLRSRSRIAIVEESPLGAGFGSELAATLARKWLRRACSGGFAPPPVPIPAARSLEVSILPDSRRLFESLVSFVTDDTSRLMPTPLRTPRVNTNDDVVRLIRVLVKPGDHVKAGDIVAEVETDKTNFVVEADHPGFVLAVVPQVDDMIVLGSVLLWLGAAPDESVPQIAATSEREIVISEPTVKAAQLLRKYGLRAIDVPASGARLSAADVRSVRQRQRLAADRWSCARQSGGRRESEGRRDATGPYAGRTWIAANGYLGIGRSR